MTATRALTATSVRGRRRMLPVAAREVDWVLLLTVGTLTTLGAVLVYSSTRTDSALTGGEPAAFLQRHLINAAIGTMLGVVVAAIDWRTLRACAAVAYGGSLLLLGAVLSPLGSTVNGSRSWLALPAGFSLQPAELAKVALVLALAVHLGRSGPAGAAANGDGEPDPPDRRRLVSALLLLGAPAALVLAQPDLGSVLVLGAIGLGMLVVAGLRVRWLVALLLSGAAGAVLAVRLGVLEDYQLARFAAFADPALDPLGIGYNTAQARLAIGSGGWWGTGPFEGTRTAGGFVPEQHTDFVFTVAGEELGFVGAGLVIVLFAVLLWRCIRIGSQSSDPAGRLVAAGVAAWFAFQAFQNIGMTLGIMPVTGLPLPFVSYGGSSMFASLLAVGMLHTVRRDALRRDPRD